MKTPFFHFVSRFILTIATVITVASCSDESSGLPTMAMIAGCSPSRTTIIERYQLTDISPVSLDLPPPRPWDHNDDALARELVKVEGRAFIAIKAPKSRRVLETDGERAGLSAGQFADGICVLEKAGAEIVTVLRSIGAVNVRLDPASGPLLRANPVVDYIEPNMPYEYGDGSVGADAES